MHKYTLCPILILWLFMYGIIFAEPEVREVWKVPGGGGAPTGNSWINIPHTGRGIDWIPADATGNTHGVDEVVVLTGTQDSASIQVLRASDGHNLGNFPMMGTGDATYSLVRLATSEDGKIFANGWEASVVMAHDDTGSSITKIIDNTSSGTMSRSLEVVGNVDEGTCTVFVGRNLEILIYANSPSDTGLFMHIGTLDLTGHYNVSTVGGIAAVDDAALLVSNRSGGDPIKKFLKTAPGSYIYDCDINKYKPFLKAALDWDGDQFFTMGESGGPEDGFGFTELSQYGNINPTWDNDFNEDGLYDGGMDPALNCDSGPTVDICLDPDRLHAFGYSNDSATTSVVEGAVFCIKALTTTPTLSGITLYDSDIYRNAAPSLYTNDLDVDVLLGDIGGRPRDYVHFSYTQDFVSSSTCIYDGDSYPFTLDSPDGEKTLWVALSNGLGLGQKRSHTILLDRLAPLSEVYQPQGACTQSEWTVPIMFLYNDNNASGIQYVYVYFKKDGGGYQQYGGTHTSSPVLFDAEPYGEGTYDFYTVAVDNAGNIEAHPAEPDVSFTLDIVDPTPTPVAIWEQPPNMVDGFDTQTSTDGLTSTVVADDWLSTSGEAIARIRWWGSYIGWKSDTSSEVSIPLVHPSGFMLRCYEYLPAPPYSQPGSLLFEEYCTDYTEEWYGSIPLWDDTGAWEHEFVYQQDLSTTWSQELDQKYFVSIQAVFEETPSYPWGWLNSSHHWNDDAVYSTDTITWYELVYPAGHDLAGDSMDMAVELLSLPPDWDEDGVPDAQENQPPLTGESNMYLYDSDGDGLSDGYEDASFNGVQNEQETGTRKLDSDGDGLSDGLEVLVLDTDPLNASDPASYTDADNDGVPASIDPDDNNPDADGDRYKDSYEFEHGTAPDNATDKPLLGDMNEDGFVDNMDAFIALNMFLGNIPLDSATGNIQNVDTNRDGFFDNMDAFIILNFFLENIPYLPTN